MEHKLLVGETKDYVIELHFDTERDFSLSGHEYNKPAFDEEQGEARAREHLEDGELWKMSVENDNTTLGLDDWVEHVLNIDGWMQTLGDIFETKDGKYIQLSGCGQIDMNLKPSDFTKCFIPKEDLEFIFKCWKKYHLKSIEKVPSGTLIIMKRIFSTKTTIENWNSQKYDLGFLINLCKTQPNEAIIEEYDHRISDLIKPETIKELMALDFQELKSEATRLGTTVKEMVEYTINHSQCPFNLHKTPKFNALTAPHWKGDMRAYYTTTKTKAEVWQMVINDLEEKAKEQ